MVFDVSKITGIGKYGSFSSGLAVGGSFRDTESSRPVVTGESLLFLGRSLRNGPEKKHSSPHQEEKERMLYTVGEGEKVFLVVNKNTIEVRTDEKLKKLLVQKYESVMESRYFGRGGIEIVAAGKQLKREEIEDLVRLSYNLTKEIK